MAGVPDPAESPLVCTVCGAEPADDAERALARLTWTRGAEAAREV